MLGALVAERAPCMDYDLDRAAGRLADLGCEEFRILGVEITLRPNRRQVQLDRALRPRDMRSGQEACCCGSGYDERAPGCLHEPLSFLLTYVGRVISKPQHHRARRVSPPNRK